MVEQRLPAAIGQVVNQLFKVDVQRATALAREFDLFHLPALMLYRDGAFHAIVESEITPTELQSTIHALLANPAQEEP